MHFIKQLSLFFLPAPANDALVLVISGSCLTARLARALKLSPRILELKANSTTLPLH